MLTMPIIASASLMFLFHFLGHASLDARRDLARLSLALVLGMSAELWFRCELFFDRFPFLLVRLVDPLVSTADKAALLDLFFKTALCCLDAGFSHKVC
jgi:hypothetical protein